MARTNSKTGSPKGEDKRKFSLFQYDMLKRCSDKKDMTEWNEWREDHPEENVLLEGANLSKCYLNGVFLATDVISGIHKEVHLEGAKFINGDLKGANLSGAKLKDAKLYRAHLDGAELDGANIENADLRYAHLEGASLEGARLDGANLSRTHLENARLQDAYIRGANLRAYLMGAKLWRAHLEGTDLWRAHLENADFYQAHLQEAWFRFTQVDGESLFADCKVDRRTDFTGVPLNNACVEPKLKQLLEYNIRRLGWMRWYDNAPDPDWGKYEREWEPGGSIWKRFLKKAFVRTFWWISDYGRSTGRVIWWFFWFAAIFAAVYRLCPDCVVVGGEVGGLNSLLHAFYFSVVTMTTLGFGDIYANPDSSAGQIILMVQVILGYMLLGALVTRFAVLFTSGGPAGKFTEMDEETKKKLEEIRAKKE